MLSWITRGGGPEADWTENGAGRGFRALDLQELWRYRELGWFLAWRDVKVRYKQAYLGAAWAVLQPLAAVAVFTLVFHRLGNVDSGDVPYQVFAFLGLAVWTYVSGSVTKGSLSLVNNSALVTKIYFPRILAPLAAVLPGLIDVGLSLGLLAVLMTMYGVGTSLAVLTLPLWVLAAAAVALGVNIWAATLNVQYRDVNHALTLFVQLWLFLSPVAYPSSLVPARWATLYALNPLTGVLDGFRWAVFGSPWPGWRLGLSLGSTLVILTGALLYFQRVERRLADVI